MTIVLLFAAMMVALRISNSVFGTSIGVPTPEERKAAEVRTAEEAKAAATRKSEGPERYKVQILAERHLRQSLRDPDRADIRNTHIPSGAGYMCGEVNATNGFGGKTGYRRFIAGAASAMPVVIEGDTVSPTEFDKLWNNRCV